MIESAAQRIAMGIALTILSCTMLREANFNPMKIWGGAENRVFRMTDRAVKYYENIRLVYQLERELKDMQRQQESLDRQQENPECRPQA